MLRTISLVPALLAAAPVFGQSIIREVRAIGTGTLADATAPGTASQFALSGGWADAEAGIPIPDDDGVSVIEVQGNAEISTTCTIRIRGLDSTGTRLFGSGYNSLFACGGLSCDWGPVDFVGTNFPFSEGTVQPISLGETRTITLTNGLCNNSQGPCVFNSTYVPGDFSWNVVLANPLLRVQGNMSSLSFQSVDAAGNSTPIELLEFSVEGSARAEHVLKLELLDAPLTPFCTSPAGSSGTTATLSAFGSQQTLTEYLTVRASGVSNNALSMLLVGTAAANRPLGFANLCVGGAASREGGLVTAAGGHADFHIDLLSRLPGDTLFLQVLHRDPSAPFVASEGARFTVLPR